MIAIKDVLHWASFPELKTAAELSAYFDKRTIGHSNFYHYTSLGAIDAILRDKTIRISSVDRFNDEKDKKQFGDSQQQKHYFSFCFSSGSNENLSLWYLYSGVNGKGGRIGFTQNALSKAIEEGSFFLTEYDYDKNEARGLSIPLIPGKTIKITLRDILYSRTTENKKYADLKYNTMTNHENIEVKELDEYRKRHPGFNKTLIWYYEKETRLLIELIGETAAMINPSKQYAVLWKPGEKVFQRIKIMLAPEICDEAGIAEYKNIRQFMFGSSRVSLSENAGDIQMNLCTKCKSNNISNNERGTEK